LVSELVVAFGAVIGDARWAPALVDLVPNMSSRSSSLRTTTPYTFTAQRRRLDVSPSTAILGTADKHAESHGHLAWQASPLPSSDGRRWQTFLCFSSFLRFFFFFFSSSSRTLDDCVSKQPCIIKLAKIVAAQVKLLLFFSLANLIPPSPYGVLLHATYYIRLSGAVSL
ncbi:hypothetical protein TRV_04536, partial [Trichophyton verrucosum HKI 0517]